TVAAGGNSMTRGGAHNPVTEPRPAHRRRKLKRFTAAEWRGRYSFVRIEPFLQPGRGARGKRRRLLQAAPAKQGPLNEEPYERSGEQETSCRKPEVFWVGHDSGGRLPRFDSSNDEGGRRGERLWHGTGCQIALDFVEVAAQHRPLLNGLTYLHAG